MAEFLNVLVHSRGSGLACRMVLDGVSEVAHG